MRMARKLGAPRAAGGHRAPCNSFLSPCAFTLFRTKSISSPALYLTASVLCRHWLGHPGPSLCSSSVRQQHLQCRPANPAGKPSELPLAPGDGAHMAGLWPPRVCAGRVLLPPPRSSPGPARCTASHLRLRQVRQGRGSKQTAPGPGTKQKAGAKGRGGHGQPRTAGSTAGPPGEGTDAAAPTPA